MIGGLGALCIFVTTRHGDFAIVFKSFVTFFMTIKLLKVCLATMTILENLLEMFIFVNMVSTREAFLAHVHGFIVRSFTAQVFVVRIFGMPPSLEDTSSSMRPLLGGLLLPSRGYASEKLLTLVLLLLSTAGLDLSSFPSSVAAAGGMTSRCIFPVSGLPVLSLLGTWVQTAYPLPLVNGSQRIGLPLWLRNRAFLPLCVIHLGCQMRLVLVVLWLRKLGWTPCAHRRPLWWTLSIVLPRPLLWCRLPTFSLAALRVCA